MNPLAGLLAHLFFNPPLASPIPQTGLQSHNIPQPASPQPVAAPQSSVTDLIKKYFPEDPNTATAVFKQESQLGKFFQPASGAPWYGVAQISLPAHRTQIPGNSDAEKIDWLRNPDNNLRIARSIYDASGWNPWGAYTSGEYKKYLQ